MPPIRVGHITLSMGQGGIENLILSLLEQFDRSVFATEVICLDQGGELADEVRSKGVPIREFSRKPGLDVKLIWNLASMLRSEKFDVVHTHNQASHFYGCLAARLAGVPVVINTEHSRHFIDCHKRRRIEKRLLSFLSDYMVFVSEELYAASLNHDGIQKKKCSVILNGIDIKKFSTIANNPPITLKTLGLPPTARIVSIIARLHPIKNHELLFRAIEIVRNRIPAIHLLVIGDGTTKQELEGLSNRLSLAGHISFLGNRRDIPELLQLSEAMVLCSKSEGLPLVLLEGMASKKPIVITEGANRAGIIEHNRNGLVTSNTPPNLAEKIVQSLSDVELSRKISYRAFEDVSSRFSINSTAQAYAKLYMKMFAGYPHIND